MRVAAWAVPLLLAGCVPLSPRNAPASEDRLIDTITEGVNVNVPVAFSRDGRRAAYAARTPDGDYAVCGGWKGRTYAVV